MKVILATPIFPPKIGGPSKYVEKLSSKLKEKGIEIEISSYSDFLVFPKILRNLIYFFDLLKKSKDSQIIYAFNLISCGLPACLISKILNKKFIMRLGGDFLWERAIEEGRTKTSLREYYKEPKNLKEKFWTCFIKKILNSANKIIFTTNFLKEIYTKYFNLVEGKTVIIQNPFPDIKTSSFELRDSNPQLLYAGRLLKLKNLDTLIKVFKNVLRKTSKNLTLKIIGEGPELNNLKLQIANLKLGDRVIIKKPISHQELLKEIQKSYLSVLPSLTEISPNFALECIKLRKPILLTKETGIYEDFKNHLIFVDPQNEKDIEEKTLYLLKKTNYRKYLKKIEAISTSYSWENVIEKHLSLFKVLSRY